MNNTKTLPFFEPLKPSKELREASDLMEMHHFILYNPSLWGKSQEEIEKIWQKKTKGRTLK
jgi:hypothetical protein